MTIRQAAPSAPSAPSRKRATRTGNGEGSHQPRRRADGRWMIRFRWTDERGAKREKDIYAATKADCSAKARAIKAEMLAGRKPADGRWTVERWAAEWLATTLRGEQLASKTVEGYARTVTKRIAGSPLGRLRMDQVAERHLTGWIADVRDEGLADSSVRTAAICLGKIMASAKRNGLIAVDPFADIKRPRVEDQGEAFWLTPEQADRFVTVAYLGLPTPEGVRAGRYRYGQVTTAPILQLIILTGLRRGEALGLRWADIEWPVEDGKPGVLWVRQSMARVKGEGIKAGAVKTERSKRPVGISSKAVALLRRVRSEQLAARMAAGPGVWSPGAHDEGLVFTTDRGRAIDPRNLLRAAHTVASAAGLPPETDVHCLRHTAATTMLIKGVPLSTVSKILGHSSISITADIYGHVAPDVAAEAMEILAAAFA